MQDDTTGGATATLELTLDDALHERDQALAQVEEAGDQWDRSVIDQGIAALNARGLPWSANDLRPRLPAVRSALIGARFLAATKRGEMTRTGWVTSTDPGTHARPVALWQPAARA